MSRGITGHRRRLTFASVRRARPVVLALAILVIGPAPACADDTTTSLEAEVLRLVNARRNERSLPPLVDSAEIATIARAHSEAMAAGRRPPGHDGFDDRWSRATARVGARTAAENVAIIPPDAASPAGMAVDTWMKSREHRKNLLDDYHYSGIGIARAGDGKLYMTHLLVGAPAGGAPLP